MAQWTRARRGGVGLKARAMGFGGFPHAWLSEAPNGLHMEFRWEAL